MYVFKYAIQYYCFALLQNHYILALYYTLFLLESGNENIFIGFMCVVRARGLERAAHTLTIHIFCRLEFVLTMRRLHECVLSQIIGALMPMNINLSELHFLLARQNWELINKLRVSIVGGQQVSLAVL